MVIAQISDGVFSVFSVYAVIFLLLDHLFLKSNHCNSIVICAFSRGIVCRCQNHLQVMLVKEVFL